MLTSNARFAIRAAKAITVTVTHSGTISVIDRLGLVVVACIAGLHAVLHQSALVDGTIVVRGRALGIRRAWHSAQQNG